MLSRWRMRRSGVLVSVEVEVAEGGAVSGAGTQARSEIVHRGVGTARSRAAAAPVRRIPVGRDVRLQLCSPRPLSGTLA